MYREFFQLDDHPFRLTADARYFFMGDGHAQASAYLHYLLRAGDGIGVLTGEPGVGKTMVLEHVLGETPEDVLVARLQQTQLDDREFLVAACLQFGIEAPADNKALLHAGLSRFAEEAHYAGKRVVLIVDEAQQLRPEVLEEIRQLAGLECHGRKILQIVLCGQPELVDRLARPEHESLSQRIRLHAHIPPLDEEEMRRYIEFRLLVAGCRQCLDIDDALLAEIGHYTAGVPRRLNILCDMLLTAACMRNTRHVDPACLNAALDKLGWAPRPAIEASAGPPCLLPGPHPQTPAFVPRIIVYRHGRPVKGYLLDRSRLLIGRHPELDIVLRSPQASRTHAQIVHIEGDYYLQDLDSKNGTLVNRRRITWHRLAHGDHVRIANHVLVYHAREPDYTRRRLAGRAAKPMPSR